MHKQHQSTVTRINFHRWPNEDWWDETTAIGHQSRVQCDTHVSEQFATYIAVGSVNYFQCSWSKNFASFTSHDFVTVDTADELITSLPGLTACIDAIDGMIEKTALILACVNHSIPIVTCGGAAGRMDPTQIVIDDLTKVSEDRLLFHCRKRLRQNHGFPKVPLPGQGKKARVRKWRINSVYSTEVQQKMDNTKADMATSSFRACDGFLGTGVFVTGCYGFVAATNIIEMIAMDSLIVPKKHGRKQEWYTDSTDFWYFGIAPPNHSCPCLFKLWYYERYVRKDSSSRAP